MAEKIVYINDIGNVKIRKNKRSKNASIAIKPIIGVIVTLPYFLSFEYGVRLVQQKKLWIEKNLPKIKALEQRTSIFDENTDFKSLHRKLIINKHSAEKIRAIISPESIQITYPASRDVRSKEIQLKIQEVILKALRIEAKEYLPQRTEEIAQKLNFTYNSVFVKNNKTLWGSCSGRNNINLNMHLLRLPSHLIDYVIIHELCHTIEKNHGPKFWKLMDSILGDSKKISKELKQFSTQFY